jgi:hypothetical protein
MAEIQVFSSTQELLGFGDPSEFQHFFVSSNIYFQQTAFFRQFPKKSIVLVKGDMQITVSTPVMMLAYQSCPHPDVIFLKNGRAKVNMRAMVAMESML